MGRPAGVETVERARIHDQQDDGASGEQQGHDRMLEPADIDVVGVGHSLAGEQVGPAGSS